MKRFAVMIAALALTAGAGICEKQAQAEETQQHQVIYRAGSQAAFKGSDKFFTGKVSVQPLFGSKQPQAPFGAGEVTFEPGARSHWHVHPLGQHLIVTRGVGRTGTADGRVEEVRAGDALWCPPGVKHWHGASPTSSMTHIALTGELPDGKNVDWLEAVSDEQYNGSR